MNADNVLEIKEEQVMVSVLCATYNHEKYIARALDGFVNQVTNFKFEVIVHEDASTDGTRTIVEKYEKEYPDLIKPIYQDVNQYSQGLGKVFGNMFSVARGKYIAMCEGDDFWIDNKKLQKQYDVMEEHTDCSICVHRVRHVFDDRNITEKVDEKTQKKRDKYCLPSGVITKERIAKALWLEGGYPAQTSSYFIRSKAIEIRKENKEPFLHCMTGDQVMLRLCLMEGNFYRFDECMSCRTRGVAGSWSAKWLAASEVERASHYVKLAKGELLFDEYSKFLFHKYIKIHLVNIIAECCIYNPESIKEFKNSIFFRWKDVYDKKTLWLYIRYCIIRISPKMYKSLIGIQKKIFKNR